MSDFFSWLEQLGLAEAVRTTPYLYAVLECIHVLGLAVLVGPAVAFDLRLLGLGRRVLPVTVAARHLLPLAQVGFVVAAVSGALMFVSGAVSIAGSGAAPFKLALLVAAGINIAVFHRGCYRGVQGWDRDALPPGRARAAAVVSLVSWTGVTVCGRLLAYT
ncbi:DUF6644 family protein [Streptomyces sp. NPDC059096]|uniref:DUF6644 family protein n=1 Tax=Streptomyces sp. NPDC059096 TaxID=3346727 RepID=UPI0036868544